MESDYISRQAVETFLRSRNYCLDTDADIEYVVECLRKEIPAANVEHVVLCRDCIWFYDGSDMKCCTNHGGVVITDENGFCHHAKTKKGGADG